MAFMQASVSVFTIPTAPRSPRRDGAETRTGRRSTTSRKSVHARSSGQGDGLRFLSEPINSPSLLAVKAAALAQVSAGQMDRVQRGFARRIRAGAHSLSASRVDPSHSSTKPTSSLRSTTISSVSTAPTVLPMKEFSRRRRITSARDEMNRLYAVESQFSVTGAMADHRLRCGRRRSAASSGSRRGVEGRRQSSCKVVGARQPTSATSGFGALAKDLMRTRARALVVAGPRQPAGGSRLVHRSIRRSAMWARRSSI